MLILILFFTRQYILLLSGIILEYCQIWFSLGPGWQQTAQRFFEAYTYFSTYDYVLGMFTLMGARLLVGKLLLSRLDPGIQQGDSDRAYQLEGQLFHSLAHYRLLLIPLVPFFMASLAGLFAAYRRLTGCGLDRKKNLLLILLIGLIEIGAYYYLDIFDFMGTW